MENNNKIILSFVYIDDLFDFRIKKKKKKNWKNKVFVYMQVSSLFSTLWFDCEKFEKILQTFFISTLEIAQEVKVSEEICSKPNAIYFWLKMACPMNGIEVLTQKNCNLVWI